MKNIYLLILIFISFYNANAQYSFREDQWAEVNYLTEELSLDKKEKSNIPVCKTPQALLEPIENSDLYRIIILNHDEILGNYELKYVAHGEDHIVGNISSIDTILLHHPDVHTIQIKNKCSELISSKWSLVQLMNTRSSSPKFPRMHYVQNNDSLYLSLMTNSTNNHLYTKYLDNYMYIKVDWKDGTSTHLYSNNKISSFISPHDTLAYIYIVPIPNVGMNVHNVKLYFGHVDNCSSYTPTHTNYVPDGHTSCGYKSQILSYITNNSLNEITVDASHFLCDNGGTPNTNSICNKINQYQDQYDAKKFNNNVIVTTSAFDATGFISHIPDNVNEVKLKIECINNVQNTTAIVDFWKKNEEFDPESWYYTTATSNTRSAYSEVKISFVSVQSDATVKECSESITVNVEDSNAICVLFDGLRTQVSQAGIPQVLFNTESEPYNFENLLTQAQLTKQQLNSLLNGTSLTYRVMDGAVEKVNSTFDYVSASSLEQLIKEIPFSFISGYNYSIKVEIRSGNTLLYDCLVEPAIFNAIGTSIGLDCNQEFANVTFSNTSSETVYVGQTLTINNFPVLILELSGDPNLGYSGRGKIPLPFEDKELFVSLVGIKANNEQKIFAGYVEGEEGVNIGNIPDFNLPPVNYGGEICIPPPNTGDLDGSGINKTTGLDGYGFDPKDKKHHITGTNYDPDGYDIDGNHKDTGAPYNLEDCSRDGKLWEPNENGVMTETDKDCSSTNTLTEIQQDSIKKWKKEVSNDLKNTISKELTRLKELRANKDNECNHQMKYINNSGYLTYDSDGLFHDKLVKGGSADFAQRPKINNVAHLERESNILDLEQKVLEWYDCDKELTMIGRQMDVLTSALDPNKLNCLKEQIKNSMDRLKSSEIEQLGNPSKMNTWKLNQVYTHMENVCGENTGLLHLDTENLSIGIASNGQNYINESFVDNMQFLYDQGKSKIGGIPRPFITERIHNYSMALNSSSSEDKLPIVLEREFNNYTVNIYISQVEIYPEYATMNVGAILTDHKDNNKKIAFGGNNVPLNPGVPQESSTKLFLQTDIGIRINNAARFYLKGGGNKTYLSWDCNGFKELQVSGSVQFCREYVLPLNPESLEPLPDPAMYELETSVAIQDLDNFSFMLSAKPFELPSLKGYKFSIDSMKLDFSEKEGTILNTPLPNAYESIFKENGSLSPLWKGFYASGIKMTLPKGLIKKSNQSVEISVPYLIIDDWGLTAQAKVNTGVKIVDFNEGNSSGWQMSIEDFSVSIVHNSIVGGGFGGILGLPVAQGNLKYHATFYKSGLTFQISPEKQLEFSPILADLELKKSSYIQAEYIDNKFYAKAHLNGTLKPKINLGLPKITFRAFEIDNKTGIDGNNTLGFSPGYWGIKKDSSSVINGLPISVDRFSLHRANQDTVVFSIGVGVNVIKDVLTAKGDIAIFSKIKSENNSVLKLKYTGFRMNSLYVDASIKNVLSLKGYINRFDFEKSTNQELSIYGSGYRGALSAKLTFLDSSPEIMALGQFGKNSDGKYYFVDMMVNTAGAINLGGISIDKLGGGLYSRMSPDYTKMSPNFNIAFEDIPSLPPGTTLTGIKYAPDPKIKLGLKLMTNFSSSAGDAFSGSGEIDVNFLDDYVLNKIALRARCQFMKKMSPSLGLGALGDFPTDIDALIKSRKLDKISKLDNVNAAISGFALFEYDRQNSSINGSVAAFLNTPGNVLRGSRSNGGLCMVDVHFSPNDWWIYMGKPTDRAGINMNLGLVRTKLSSYLNIGTKIPPFPGLPQRFNNIKSKFNFDELSRQSGAGFAFGASMDFSFDATYVGTGLQIDVGAGFDIMLKKYSDIQCYVDGQSKDIGIDGWYAAGQAWAYIDGKVTLLGLPVFEAGVAAALQIQTPNPTYIYGTLEGNFGKSKWDGTIEIGEPCNVVNNGSSSFGQDLILDMYPFGDDAAVGTSSIPQVNFTLPLKKGIKDFYFVESQQTKDIRFEIDVDSTGVFNKYGRIAIKTQQDRNINYLKFKPVDLLLPNSTYTLRVKIDIYAGNQFLESETRIVEFKTTERDYFIKPENINWTYPIEGMTNFYTKNLLNQKGFIALNRNQFYLYSDDTKEVVVKISNPNGQVVYTGNTEYIIENLGNIIRYDLPDQYLTGGTNYKIELVRRPKSGGVINDNTAQRSSVENKNESEKVIYTNYFRTSQYKTLGEKVTTMATNASRQRRILGKNGSNYKYICGTRTNLSEPFDVLEIGSGSNNLIKFYYNLIDPAGQVPLHQAIDTSLWPIDYSFSTFSYQVDGITHSGISGTEESISDKNIGETEYNQGTNILPSGIVRLYGVSESHTETINRVSYAFPWGENRVFTFNTIDLGNIYTLNFNDAQTLTETIKNNITNY